MLVGCSDQALCIVCAMIKCAWLLITHSLSLECWGEGSKDIFPTPRVGSWGRKKAEWKKQEGEGIETARGLLPADGRECGSGSHAFHLASPKSRVPGNGRQARQGSLDLWLLKSGDVCESDATRPWGTWGG